MGFSSLNSVHEAICLQASSKLRAQAQGMLIEQGVCSEHLDREAFLLSFIHKRAEEGVHLDHKG